jgi:hypothetical protein
MMGQKYQEDIKALLRKRLVLANLKNVVAGAREKWAKSINYH